MKIGERVKAADCRDVIGRQVEVGEGRNSCECRHVGYPIVRLAKPSELVGFVREIESGLIAVCAELGINAQCFSGRSGVWIRDEKGDRKIAAIGIRVAKGVTMHGFALNVCPDLSAFDQIIPCGIADADVTSIEKELARAITVEDVAPIVERYIFESLKRVSI